jgi:hypothetical protein
MQNASRSVAKPKATQINGKFALCRPTVNREKQLEGELKLLAGKATQLSQMQLESTRTARWKQSRR